MERRLDKLSAAAPEGVEAAREFANALFRESTPTPNVLLNDDYSVSFTWHKRGIHMDVEFSDAGGGFVWVYRDDDDTSVLYEFPEGLSTVRETLRFLEEGHGTDREDS